jgi:hypothetical protein
MVLCDPTTPDHSKHNMTWSEKWKEYYPYACEEMPHDMPQVRGKGAAITIYVDADRAHDQVTRRSVTGIVAKINGMVVRTFCKRQKTVESSSFGSELVAARIAVDMVVELRTALRVMGVPLDGPAVMLGDNRSVVLNTTLPSSVLKKKHCGIAYHRIREAIAAQALIFVHIPSAENEADILTKPLPKESFYRVCRMSLFRQPPGVHNTMETVNPVIEAKAAYAFVKVTNTKNDTCPEGA